MDLREKIVAVGESLKTQFLERDQIVDGMLNAALAGKHVLLVGPPGTAKSALVTSFTACVTGASYFEWLLGRFTVPEELFGPLSLKGLKEENFKRVTKGKLPEAHVGFLDEVFKAGPAILNTLLPVMNERKFYNNGTPAAVPLRMLVGASNELPEGAELAALYDRFLVRFWVDYIGTADNWVSMLLGTNVAAPSFITLAEWDQARAAVQTVTIDAEVVRDLHKLRAELAQKHSIILSDRRWKECVGLLRAEAWRMGDTEVVEDHFRALAPALWDDRAQIQAVADTCEAAAGASSNEANRIVKTVRDAIGQIPQTPPGDKPSAEVQNQMVAAHREGTRGLAKLKELLLNAKTPRSKKTTEAAIKVVEGILAPMKATMRQMLEI
jgi:MoxR-like ATPase